MKKLTNQKKPNQKTKLTKIHKKLSIFTLTCLTIINITACKSTQIPNVFTKPNSEPQILLNKKPLWKKSGSTYILLDNSALPINKSRLVFMRPKDDYLPNNTINININNRFQVSLQNQHYSEVINCAGSQNIEFSLNHKTEKFSQNFQTSPKQTYYFLFKINPQTAQPELTQINEELANQELIGLNQQIHQISRATEDYCGSIFDLNTTNQTHYQTNQESDEQIKQTE